MNVRKFKKEDYEDVCKWWTKQDFPPLTMNLFPKNGFIVSDEKEKIAAVWVFKTDSPVYIISWFVGNPDISHEKRGSGLDILIEEAADWSKKDGAEILFSTTGHKRLMDRLQKNNFIMADTDTANFIRRL